MVNKNHEKFRISLVRIFLLCIIVLALINPLVTEARITLITNKAKYYPGDTLIVSGIAIPNSAVTIRIYNPFNNFLTIGQCNVTADGLYNLTIFIWPDQEIPNIPFGVYKINVTDASDGEMAGTTIEFVQLIISNTTSLILNVTFTKTITSTTTSTTTLRTTVTSKLTTTSTTTNTLTTTTTLSARTTTVSVTSTQIPSTITKTITSSMIPQTQTETVTQKVTMIESESLFMRWDIALFIALTLVAISVIVVRRSALG